MIILAADPGTSQSAFLVLGDRHYEIIDKGKVANAELIAMVRTGYFDMLAIEGFQSFGMPVGKEVLKHGLLHRQASCRSQRT